MGADFLRMLDPEEKKKIEAESMQALFTAMDINGDNYVTPEEIKESLESVGAPAQMISTEVQTLMTRDKDGDGKLSKSEFTCAGYSIAGRSAGWLSKAIAQSLKEKEKSKALKAEAKKLEGKGVDFFEFLFGKKLVSKSGDVDVKSFVSGKDYIGVYFSAHWCGPCRGFTPQLAEAFAMIESKGVKKFGVVFVSADRSEAAFKEYYGSMPWNAIPFSEKELIGFEGKAASLLECQGIPHLAIYDGNGKLVNGNATNLVRQFKEDFISKL